MNATQQSRPSVQPVEPRLVPHKKMSHRRRHYPYRTMALETTAKLTANVVISVLAVSGIARLLPYQWSQYDKLQEVTKEVNQAEGRINKLQTNFTRYFDPQQARSVMQEQSTLVNPGQRQVLLLKTGTNAPAQPPSP